jgi:hypothetical protein
MEIIFAKSLIPRKSFRQYHWYQDEITKGRIFLNFEWFIAEIDL